MRLQTHPWRRRKMSKAEAARAAAARRAYTRRVKFDSTTDIERIDDAMDRVDGSRHFDDVLRNQVNLLHTED